MSVRTLLSDRRNASSLTALQRLPLLVVEDADDRSRHNEQPSRSVGEQLDRLRHQ